MDQATLKRLRPSKDSAAAIRQSLYDIAAERDSTVQACTQRKSSRGQLLLTADAKKVAENDDEIRVGEIFVEQLDLMVEELTERLKLAVAREKAMSLQAQAEVAAEAANKLTEQWNEFWYKSYQQIAEALAAGVQLQNAALAARDAAQTASKAAIAAGAPRIGVDLTELAWPLSRRNPQRKPECEPWRLAGFLFLPAPPGEPDPVWDNNPWEPPKARPWQAAELQAYSR